MQEGDRVMVYDSPGSPLDHYLYANVLHVPENKTGALVLVDHPGNLSHGQQKFVKSDQIMTAADALRLADDARTNAKKERDSTRRKAYLEHAQHHDFVASQLS